jgi:Flp pilus assembly protein TadB
MNKQEKLYYGLSLAAAFAGWMLRFLPGLDILFGYRLMVFGLCCIVLVYTRYARRLKLRNEELESLLQQQAAEAQDSLGN